MTVATETKDPAKHFTCHNCGKTYKVRPWKDWGRRCNCLVVRQAQTREKIEEFQEYECIFIADHERTLLRNAPMSQSKADELLDFDALYEDMLFWNRRSGKCVATGVPDECLAGNPDGTARRDIKDIVCDGKIFEEKPAGKPWPKKKPKPKGPKTSFPVAMCKQCGGLFPKTRSDRLHCSPACTVKSNYYKKKAEAAP